MSCIDNIRLLKSNAIEPWVLTLSLEHSRCLNTWQREGERDKVLELHLVYLKARLTFSVNIFQVLFFLFEMCKCVKLLHFRFLSVFLYSPLGCSDSCPFCTCLHSTSGWVHTQTPQPRAAASGLHLHCTSLSAWCILSVERPSYCAFPLWGCM